MNPQHKEIPLELSEVFFLSLEEASFRISRSFESIGDQTIKKIFSTIIIEDLYNKWLDKEKISQVHILPGNKLQIEWIHRDGCQKIFFIVDTNIATNIDISEDERQKWIEQISYDRASAKQQELVSQAGESILELDVLSKGINNALDKNQNEYWQNLGEEDIISHWVFEGNTITEAILIYRKKIIQASGLLRNIWPKRVWRSSKLQKIETALLQSQEEYLLLSFGIGQTREALTHVVPKTQTESLTLIWTVLARKSPREALDWVKQIHSQIDANNWQSGTVEKNYQSFAEMLNVQLLTKIKTDVYHNKKSGNYQKPDILFEFAVFTSGRAAWNKESYPLLADWWENASPMDKRLWDPEIAEEALLYAMKIQRNGEMSVMSKMAEKMTISDEIVWSTPPNGLVLSTIKDIKSSVQVKNAAGKDIFISEINEDDFLSFLQKLGYADIYKKALDKSLGTYQKLDIKDKIALGSIARLKNSINKQSTQTKIEYSNTPYVVREW